jgi:fatty acid desaturase
LAAIPTSRGSARLPLPAATLLVTVVYLAGAAIALALGGPAQRLVGLAVVAVTAVRLTALRGARRGAGPWS